MQNLSQYQLAALGKLVPVYTYGNRLFVTLYQPQNSAGQTNQWYTWQERTMGLGGWYPVPVSEVPEDVLDASHAQRGL